MTLPSSPNEFPPSLRTSRIEGLSDAVFGIVMTILVVEIPVPELESMLLETDVFIDVALVVLLLGFIGTMSLATYLERLHDD